MLRPSRTLPRALRPLAARPSASLPTSHRFPTSPFRALSLLTHTSDTPVFFNAVSPPSSSSSPSASAGEGGVIPSFRLLTPTGSLSSPSSAAVQKLAASVDPHTLERLMRVMTTLPVLDQILYSSQRQGRISFYMTSYGEEGAVVGSAAAWADTDEVFAQYREVGVLLWRGYPLSSLMAQVLSTSSDVATKGRQMPVHYGSRTHHFHTISSPLGTQFPQAAGAAYALKLRAEKLVKEEGKSEEQAREEAGCVVCYAGEGAASEGDWHAGLNMASVLGGPIVFFVRNNGFAISTPSSQQYAGDGIASRGPGYGIDTLRVDGNDPLAVLVGCREARRRAVQGQKPVLVEAMSYRVGHHSTSDDSSAYRSPADVSSVQKLDSPLFRLRQYLESLPPPSPSSPSSSSSDGEGAAWWSDAKDAQVKAEAKKAVLAAFSAAERQPRPPLSEMFTDVFASLERPQREQRAELKRLVGKWGGAHEGWRRELGRFEGGAGAVEEWEE
ncbi:hypothetical protein JCM8097_000514 [Rhodosporidiobolus ruineniae]